MKIEQDERQEEEEHSLTSWKTYVVQGPRVLYCLFLCSSTTKITCTSLVTQKEWYFLDRVYLEV